MKRFFITLYFVAFLVGGVLAQPAMTSTNIFLDVDGRGGRDFVYSISATGGTDGFTEAWEVGCGIDVLVSTFGSSRFLRADAGRVAFQRSESVGAAHQVYQRVTSYPPSPPTIGYGLGVMAYHAINYSPDHATTWEYTAYGTFPVFDGQTEVLLGVRLTLATGTHHGWLRMSRPVADTHTLFEITGHDWNPIPNAPIGAGEPPPPPPLHTAVGEDGQLTFQWDISLGEMLLEWSDSLAEPVDWQPVPDSAWPPVQVPLAEGGQRFFRLRKP